MYFNNKTNEMQNVEKHQHNWKVTSLKTPAPFQTEIKPTFVSKGLFMHPIYIHIIRAAVRKKTNVTQPTPSVPFNQHQV